MYTNYHFGNVSKLFVWAYYKKVSDKGTYYIASVIIFLEEQLKKHLRICIKVKFINEISVFLSIVFYLLIFLNK